MIWLMCYLGMTIFSTYMYSTSRVVSSWQIPISTQSPRPMLLIISSPTGNGNCVSRKGLRIYILPVTLAAVTRWITAFIWMVGSAGLDKFIQDLLNNKCSNIYSKCSTIWRLAKSLRLCSFVDIFQSILSKLFQNEWCHLQCFGNFACRSFLAVLWILSKSRYLYLRNSAKILEMFAFWKWMVPAWRSPFKFHYWTGS